MKTESKNVVEGMVEVCAHRVTYCYWDFEAEITDTLIDQLHEEAEQRAKHCIADGFISGELNYLDTDTEEEIRGWWKIQGA